MSPTIRRSICHVTACGLLAAWLAGPSAPANRDVRPPDRRELPSAVVSPLSHAADDVRAPDTRDVAANFPKATPATMGHQASPGTPDWRTAGITAAAIGAMLFIALLGTGLARQGWDRLPAAMPRQPRGL